MTRVEGKDLVVRADGGYSTAEFETDTQVDGGSLETDGPIVISAIGFPIGLFTIGPEFNADLVDGEPTYVFGLSFGLGF